MISDDFLRRVQRAYRIALDHAPAHYGRIWSTIDRKRAPIHGALVAPNTRNLRAIFENPVATDLFLGLDYACHSILDYPQERLAGELVTSADIRSHLISVATRRRDLLGPIASYENSPAFPNEPVPSYRDVLAIYQARCITMRSPASVIEIGPGLGRTAYYCWKVGIRDYTTVDLPLGIVAQACYLSMALGPGIIWLPGDGPQYAEGRIALRYEPPNRDFDLAFNADSMTEMPLRTALGYLAWIHRHCNHFVSINHTTNLFTVRHIAKKWFRFGGSRPYPMQPGYVEEWFSPHSVPRGHEWGQILPHALKTYWHRAVGALT